MTQRVPSVRETKQIRLIALALLFLAFGSAGARAKEKPAVLLWPNSGAPTLKLTFGKFRELGAYGGAHDLAEDVTVENISPKNIAFASFTVYLLDKNNVRIGDTTLQVKDLGSGQQVRTSLQFHTTGMPASVKLLAANEGGVPTSLKTVPLKIISVPPDASLKIDGQAVGFTPFVANLTAGNHTLEFSKEGYATGTTPLDVAPNELPGGSVTFELGGLSKDTLELRDGTVLLCDLLSMSMTEVKVRVAGQEQTYDRNRVKKIILVERMAVREPASPQPPHTGTSSPH